MKLRKSPFKPDQVESNPNAFALRVNEIAASVSSLYNLKNVLITGPRGIGKSSLAYQLQKLYEPDSTILRRCNIEGRFPKFLRVFYAVDDKSTLLNICLDILYRIEQECILLKEFQISDKKKLSLQLNFGIFKASLESNITSRSPGSIIAQFVAGIKEAYTFLPCLGMKGINILIDEVDLLSTDINFAHFLKLIHEYCSRDGIKNITFILAGQRGVYSRLLSEDKSVERLLTHIPISKLDVDESEHILNYACVNAEPAFTIEDDAKEAIMKIGAGYPYEIHLIADAAFWNMDDPNRMQLVDVSDGLRHVLQSDKYDKYLWYLSQMTQPERILIATLGGFQSNEMPVRIPISWIEKELSGKLKDNDISQTLESLRASGHLIIDIVNNSIQFNDELFKIFLLLRQSYFQFDKEDFSEEMPIASYSDKEIQTVVEYMEQANFNPDWDIDEYDYLMNL